ncbi:hypothetical protein J5Y03_04640 [Bacillus sp. RG28]|uniref:Glycosyltransferase RgtA/B/C/D-like domain-containing protein n=1 Tax=Gottfriedia endophytica TaxID=2820819 RepID=A0A940SHZ9_9BACI|nr:hypothetical protein [Gottfriedia endophytica]MBP0724475.1 hypothetical protein [Gottfriedia endophytica]
MNNLTINYYLLIVLITFLLAVLLSMLFKHPKSVIKIILFGLSFRILILIVLKIYSYHLGLDGFFPGDVDAYAYNGDAVKAIHSHSWLQALEGNLSYTVFVAYLYNLFGPDMNIPQLINLGASVLIIPLIYELANRVGGRKVGVNAALLWCLFPSAAFWSVSLLKDSLVTLGMVLSGFLILGISEKKIDLKDSLLGVCGILIVSSLRPQFLLAIALPIMINIGFQFYKGKSNFLRNIIIIVMGIIIFSTTSAGNIIVNAFGHATSQEGVNQINEIALQGSGGIKLVTMFPPQIRWLVELPFSILAPFPGQLISAGQKIYLLSTFEMIFWYFLYFIIWKNRKLILIEKTGKLIFLYAFSIFIAVSFSLPNIGSIYRYRLAALTLLLPLITYKFIGKKERSG